MSHWSLIIGPGRGGGTKQDGSFQYLTSLSVCPVSKRYTKGVIGTETKVNLALFFFKCRLWGASKFITAGCSRSAAAFYCYI